MQPARSKPESRQSSTSKHPCPYADRLGCTKSYTTKHNALRHGKQHMEDWPCSLCSKVCGRKDSLKEHLRYNHSGHSLTGVQPRRLIHPNDSSSSEEEHNDEADQVSGITALDEGQASEDSGDASQKLDTGAFEYQTYILGSGFQTAGQNLQSEGEFYFRDGDSTSFDADNEGILAVDSALSPTLPSEISLKPVLKRCHSHSSTLVPSDDGTVSEHRPKKRVRFSSPLGDTTPPSSPPIRHLSPVPESLEPYDHPQFEDITFYHSSIHGYCAITTRNNISYSRTQRRQLLLNGHAESADVGARGPLARASRWADDNYSMGFYYAQLLHRGLPTTRSQEVAKWILYEDELRSEYTEERNVRLRQIKDIKRKLKRAHKVALPNFKDEGRKVDHDEPEWNERGEDEVKDWMVEETASRIGLGEEYDEVMRYWVIIRSPLSATRGDETEPEDIVQRAKVSGHLAAAQLQLLASNCSNNKSDKVPLPNETKLSAPIKPSLCPLCVSDVCLCSTCERCGHRYYRNYVHCRCYCQDCDRPIAKAHGVKRESAPPGWYCRCHTDPVIKEHYDRVLKRPQLFTGPSYEDIVRMSRELEEEEAERTRVANAEKSKSELRIESEDHGAADQPESEKGKKRFQDSLGTSAPKGSRWDIEPRWPPLTWDVDHDLHSLNWMSDSDSDDNLEDPNDLDDGCPDEAIVFVDGDLRFICARCGRQPWQCVCISNEAVRSGSSSSSDSNNSRCQSSVSGLTRARMQYDGACDDNETEEDDSYKESCNEEPVLSSQSMQQLKLSQRKREYQKRRKRKYKRRSVGAQAAGGHVVAEEAIDRPRRQEESCGEGRREAEMKAPGSEKAAAEERKNPEKLHEEKEPFETPKKLKGPRVETEAVNDSSLHAQNKHDVVKGALQPQQNDDLKTNNSKSNTYAAIKATMVEWVKGHCPEIFDSTRRPTQGASQTLSVEQICGTYELVSPPLIADAQRGVSELVLLSDDDALYGRFRLQDGRHGLLKVPNIPEASSTGGVRVHAIIEDPQERNGSWVVLTEADGKQAKAGKMIFFGGPGLVILEHPVFGEKAVFGLQMGKWRGRRGGESEDLVDGLRESWDAICLKFGGKGYLERSFPLENVSWDEEVVDRMVDDLRKRTSKSTVGDSGHD